MFSKFLFAVTFSLFAVLKTSEGANILFFHQLSSYSHRIAVWPLVEELAKRGHNVTFHHIYHPKMPNPNITEFIPLEAKDIWDFGKMNKNGIVEDLGFNLLNKRLEGGYLELLKDDVMALIYGLEACEKFLALPEFLEFVEINKFDLVIIDAFFNECAYGLAHKWGAKTIHYYTSVPTGVWGGELIGFLQTGESSWIADTCAIDAMPMSFTNRIVSFMVTAFVHVVKEWYYYPKLTEMLQQTLKLPDMPAVNELVKNTDLAFYNSHFSEELARSLPPMFVPVPALHAWGKKPKALPKSIAEFVDGSGEEGFIYVSFGSKADPATAPEEFQNIFFEAFAQTKIRFLWKWTGNQNKKISDNIYTEEWMPQYDILASPKCRGFIGHGGLLGIQEAILNAVPMIVMPVFAEQGYNAHRIQRTGRGIQVEPTTLTANKLKEAIQELLTNPKYKQNVLKVSNQLKDQLNTPLETAVYWTEYVLRHDDLLALKPLKSTHHYWFQVYLLDVYTFFVFVGILLIYTTYKSMIFVFSCFNRTLVRKASKQKTN